MIDGSNPSLRRTLTVALLLSAVLSADVLVVADHALGWATRATITRGYVSEARMPVAPGVMHDQGAIETDTAGRQAIHLLEIDPHNPVITLEASISNDRVAGLETTSSQANRKSAEGHRAVAGINGDFWGTLETPIGLHIQAGELVTSPQAVRPTFGIKSNGDPIIGDPVITGTVTGPSGTRFSLARVNQPRGTGQLVLYTPRFHTSTRTDNSGAEVVLTGIGLPIKSKGAYGGTVKQIRPGAGDTPIGSGEVVFSGNGAAANFLTSLSTGAQLSFSVSISAGWEDVTNAVGGGQYIVRNGMVNVSPHDPAFADVTHPRTAIGITPKGEVIMASVDGRQPGYSIGVRLDELGELMRARGAMTSINLDGGGSTTMAVRQPGDSSVTVVNRGSDGFERAVSNSLLLFSSAPTGPLAMVNVLPSSAAVIVGSRIDYVVKGQDAAFNPSSVASESVSWSVSGEEGKIDASGRFTGIAPGMSTVTASIGAVTGSTSVAIIDALSGLDVRPNPAIVTPGGMQTFTTLGKNGSRADVRIDAAQATWSVSGPIGTIDAGGILSAAAVAASGRVIASASGATGSARVDIGRPPEILEDFEDISDMQASAVRARASLTNAMRPDPVRSGTRSARLSYDFTASDPGTSAAYAVHSPLRPIDGRPLRLGIWFYGDATRHWVRGNYRDGNNTQKTVDFTSAPSPTPATRDDCGRRGGGIDWTGWKYLEAPIPPDAVVPLKWERVYVVETSDLCDNASSVYLDDLRAVYSDTGEDFIGPSVTELTPEPGSIITGATPPIGGTVRDNPGGSGVAPASIRLLVDDIQVSSRYETITGIVRYTPTTPLTTGIHHVRLEANDNSGNPALPFGEWSFTIRTGALRKVTSDK